MIGGPPLLHRRIRCYLNLRTAHLERAHAFVPASILYAHRKYDFDASLVDGLDLVRAGAWRTAWLVLRSRPTVLEVNEPLMWQGQGRTLLAIAAARVSGLLRRNRVPVVAYAIENRDPATSRPVRWRGRLRRLRDATASRLVARSLDRVAFGTPGSERLYADVHGRDLRRAEQRLVPAVPAACTCPDGDQDAGEVLFVGAFDERKGVTELLGAWPLVAAARPDASLQVIGQGPLADEVAERVAQLERARVDIDPPRSEIHACLRRAAALVLLSQPHSRWREQVGLPIVEGLSHGCAVVTTEQSGLAGWLSDHGHAVVASDASAQEIASAVLGALDGRRPASQIMADLPRVDGREAADRWLMTGGS
ncbi:glycosyltransferase [Aeromicrobium sp.]|uniref:glycosyltransferase n=1 Tax=Aeromicrobium sp. TaxID=1871063 RepID=UPI0028B0B877|nr:glycosyltransferase [Aeromicrobium sp.]